MRLMAMGNRSRPLLSRLSLTAEIFVNPDLYITDHYIFDRSRREKLDRILSPAGTRSSS